MHPPHSFPSLIDPHSVTKPVLLIGAGMSAEIVPMPFQLAGDLAPKQALMEKMLDCESTAIQITPQNPETIYIWAEEIFDQLTKIKGLKDTDAKRALADALGVTSDVCWRGKTKIPLRGNTPRHRVIARFAREGRWYAFWSLNWDCVLETALESIGMPIHPEKVLSRKQPWAEWHRTWTQPSTLPPHDDESSILIVKPHGCAGKLSIGTNDTFKVTFKELASIGENLEQDKEVLKNHFFQRPLITCGWSASEAYLRKWFSDLSANSSIPANVIDPLAIVDLKPNINHLEVIKSYKVDVPESAQITVDLNQCTTDNLFLWLQTRFGLNSLKDVAGSPASKLDALLGKFAHPISNHWLNDWFDSFLPVWMRFCFNSEITKFIVHAAPMDFDAIPTDRRDEHIPCSYQKVSRPDLIIATHLLMHLYAIESENHWDFSRFPGGLWDKKNRRLILPQPFIDQHYVPKLSTLKMMTENHHWERMGEISQLDILLIDQNGEEIIDLNLSKHLRLSVSKLMKHSFLADFNNIGVVGFNALKEQST